MRAVVIGGTGFLGLNLVRALQLQGAEVRATRRASSNTIFARRLGVELVHADLGDVESLTKAMAERDVVFFAAGHYPRFAANPQEQVQTAVSEMQNVVEAAHRADVSRLVYTGSVMTVARPDAPRPATEADGTAASDADSTYLEVKLAMERTLLEAVADGLDAVITLPTGCLGPFDHKVGTGFFVVGTATRALDVWVDGTINMVDARDVAAGHVRAALRGERGQRYILGGHNLTAGELLQRVAKVAGVEMPAQQLTAPRAKALADAEEERCRLTGGRRATLSRDIVDAVVHGQFVSSELAHHELGYTYRPLEETIADSYEWYQKQGYIARRTKVRARKEGIHANH